MEGQGSVRTAEYPIPQPFGVDFRGRSRTDAFLDLNPAGSIPVLELEDGRTIAGSNAILTYLAEGTPFLPTDRYQRAKVMQWLFFEQYHVEPVIGTLRFWTLTGRLEINQAMVSSQTRGRSRTLAALERSSQIRCFLPGKNFRSQTFAVYAYGHRAEDCGFVLADYPALLSWFDRVRDAIEFGYPIYPYSDDPHSAA